MSVNGRKLQNLLSSSAPVNAVFVSGLMIYCISATDYTATRSAPMFLSFFLYVFFPCTVSFLKEFKFSVLKFSLIDVKIVYGS